jgi:hypothetical protein
MLVLQDTLDFLTSFYSKNSKNYLSDKNIINFIIIISQDHLKKLIIDKKQFVYLKRVGGGILYALRLLEIFSIF